MKHPLTSLSLLGLTLLASTGQAAPTDEAQPDAVTPAAVRGSTPFDDVLFAPYPELHGQEFLETLRTGRLARTIATALNSDGDELKLHLNRELFVPIPVPGLSVGGSVDQEVTLARRQLDDGTTVYELSGGKSLFGAVNGSVGIASAAVGGGRTTSVMWRFSSIAELVLAVHGLVFHSALGEQAGLKASELTRQLVATDAALAPIRAIRAQFRGWLAPYLPTWVNDRLATLTAARARLSAALSQLDEMARLLESFEVTRSNQPIFVKIELGAEGAATLGATILEAGGEAAGVVGLGWEGSLTPAVSIVAEVHGGLPRRADVELRLQRTTSLRGGALASLDAELDLQLVVTGSGTFGPLFMLETVSDRVELSVNRSFAPTGWLVAGAQYAVGRRTSAFVDLSELCSLGAEGIDALVAQDSLMAAGLLSQLPVTFEGQARIQRAGYAGLKLDLGERYFSFGVHAAVWWTDEGTAVTLERPPSPAEVVHFFTDEVSEQETQETIDVLAAVAVGLGLDPH